MGSEIILSPGYGIRKITDADGETRAVHVFDDTVLPGQVSVELTADAGQSGFQVQVGLPQWAIDSGLGHAETLSMAHFPGPDLFAGANIIDPTMLGYPANSAVISFWARAVGAAGQASAWKKRTLYSRVEEPTPYPPLEIVGIPEMTAASSVWDAAVSYKWPTANRPAKTEEYLRLYDAAVDGNLVETIPAPARLPNNVDLYAVPYWRVLDVVTGQWVEREGTVRIQIEDSVDPGVILSSDIEWSVEWQNPSQRILYTIPSVIVAGVGRGDGLRARISCERYTTSWQECSLRDPIPAMTLDRVFPIIAAPATQPGVNVSEFYPRGQERRSIQFSKRSGSGPWTDVGEVKFTAPVPTGTVQPTHVVTTSAGLRAAIDNARNQSSVQLIAINADMIDIEAITIANIVKPGRPLIITQANHNAPKMFRGWNGAMFRMNNMQNIIFEGLEFRNNRTELSGSTSSVPARQINTGNAIRGDNVRRIHVLNCVTDKTRNSLYFEYSYGLWVAYNVQSRGSEDDIRIFGGAHNCTIEGNYSHTPEIYSALTTVTLANPYHPDWLQAAFRTGSNALKGFPNLKVVNNYVIGFDGYKAPLQLGSESNAVDTEELLSQFGYVNIQIRNNYFLVDQQCSFSGFKNAIVENNVWRQFPSSFRNNPSINSQGRHNNTVIRNNVSSHQIYFGTAIQSGMSAAERAAQTIGRVTVSATGWPPTWPASSGDRSRVYPHGPMAYAA